MCLLRCSVSKDRLKCCACSETSFESKLAVLHQAHSAASREVVVLHQGSPIFWFASVYFKAYLHVMGNDDARC